MLKQYRAEHLQKVEALAQASEHWSRQKKRPSRRRSSVVGHANKPCSSTSAQEFAVAQQAAMANRVQPRLLTCTIRGISHRLPGGLFGFPAPE